MVTLKSAGQGGLSPSVKVIRRDQELQNEDPLTREHRYERRWPQNKRGSHGDPENKSGIVITLYGPSTAFLRGRTAMKDIFQISAVRERSASLIVESRSWDLASRPWGSVVLQRGPHGRR